MKWLYPIVTGRSLFDSSSVIHFCFWVFVGSNFAYFKKPFNKALIFMVCLASAWEVFEHFAEKRWPTIWMHPESWYNAWVSDLLMGILGILVAYWLIEHQ